MVKDQTSSKGNQKNDGLFYPLFILVILGFLSKFFSPWIREFSLAWRVHHFQIMMSIGACLFGFLVLGMAHFWNFSVEKKSQKAVLEKDKTSIFVGVDKKTKQEIHLKEEFRVGHTQVNGTTNAGKTASITMPWAVQDIEQGRGVLIMDGKADQSFLNKLYSYAVKYNRQKDFKVFSLSSPALSSTYNPFGDGTAEQITERFFSTLEINDPYYKGIQFSALRTVLALLMRRGEKPMPGVVRELLRNKSALRGWLTGLEDPNLITDVQAMLDDKEDEFQKKYSGLVTALGHFSQGQTASLYNTRHPEITLMEVIRRKQICYFQLPTMQFPFLGEATGKLILQSLQSVVSEIQGNGHLPESLFSVYLDDFNDYIYPAFASLLNKSRSANVGVVFSHQSLGDLEKVSPDFKQIVMTNTNIKVVMRSNDPDSAEHFSKIIGTESSEKTTERRTHGLLGKTDTGDQSVREVEEYKVHPNVIKSELGRGEGILVVPHPNGTEIKQVQFKTVPDLPAISLPIRDLPIPDLLREATFSGGSSSNVKTLQK